MPFLFVNSSFPVVATKMFQTESVWGCLELVSFTNKFQVSGLHVSLGLAHDPAAAAEFGVVAITEFGVATIQASMEFLFSQVTMPIS